MNPWPTIKSEITMAGISNDFKNLSSLLQLDKSSGYSQAQLDKSIEDLKALADPTTLAALEKAGITGLSSFSGDESGLDRASLLKNFGDVLKSYGLTEADLKDSDLSAVLSGNQDISSALSALITKNMDSKIPGYTANSKSSSFNSAAFDTAYNSAIKSGKSAQEAYTEANTASGGMGIGAIMTSVDNNLTADQQKALAKAKAAGASPDQLKDMEDQFKLENLSQAMEKISKIMAMMHEISKMIIGNIPRG
jgi:hypothetical protein